MKRTVALTALILGSWAHLARAQTYNAGLRGVVRDPGRRGPSGRNGDDFRRGNRLLPSRSNERRGPVRLRRRATRHLHCPGGARWLRSLRATGRGALGPEVPRSGYPSRACVGTGVHHRHFRLSERAPLLHLRGRPFDLRPMRGKDENSRVHHRPRSSDRSSTTSNRKPAPELHRAEPRSLEAPTLWIHAGALPARPPSTLHHFDFRVPPTSKSVFANPTSLSLPPRAGSPDCPPPPPRLQFPSRPRGDLPAHRADHGYRSPRRGSEPGRKPAAIAGSGAPEGFPNPRTTGSRPAR